MLCWLYENSGALVSSIIGAVATIIVVVLTIRNGNKHRKEDLIAQAKPIVINYDATQIDNYKSITQVMFEFDQADNDEKTGNVCGTFKNTDNGVLFIDCFKTESKKYLPTTVATIDKNTIFQIYVKIVRGETLKGMTVYCHDIYGNKYKYDVVYKPESFENIFELTNGEPILVPNLDKKLK